MNKVIEATGRGKVIYAAPEMIPLKEASSRTGLSYDWLRRSCLQGKLVYIRSGNKYLLNWEFLVRYLNTGEQQGKPAEAAASLDQE